MGNSKFYDAGLLRQTAINLFYGWGYNFYRKENQLRADDQLIRAKAASLLGTAVSSITTAETEYRRINLPPPTRAKPYPDPVAVETAQHLERLAREIAALEALIHQQPVPENDRMTERYRQEAPTLKALIHYDEQLVGQCELLRSTVYQKDSAEILAKLPELESGLEAIRATLLSREDVLLDRAL